jgi:hypothetical protein
VTLSPVTRMSGSAYVTGDIKGDYLINEVAGIPVLMGEHP